MIVALIARALRPFEVLAHRLHNRAILASMADMDDAHLRDIGVTRWRLRRARAASLREDAMRLLRDDARWG